METSTLDRTFSALSDPARREIVRRLVREPATVAQIAEPFSMSRPAVSKHLKVLRLAGVVESRTEGRRNWYSIVDGAFDDANEWLEGVQAMWETALTSLKNYVEETSDGDDQ